MYQDRLGRPCFDILIHIIILFSFSEEMVSTVCDLLTTISLDMRDDLRQNFNRQDMPMQPELQYPFEYSGEITSEGRTLRDSSEQTAALESRDPR